MRISAKFYDFPVVDYSESRNRNLAHKINKERVSITSGTMILFNCLILTLQAMLCAFCRSRDLLCCKSVMPRTGAELK